MPASASAIEPFTLPTAFSTPLPAYRFLSPSRSSSASRSPVDAPDGTAAVPLAPPERTTVASTVEKPRASRISRARTVSILAICGLLVGGLGGSGRRVHHDHPDLGQERHDGDHALQPESRRRHFGLELAPREARALLRLEAERAAERPTERLE